MLLTVIQKKNEIKFPEKKECWLGLRGFCLLYYIKLDMRLKCGLGRQHQRTHTSIYEIFDKLEE